MSSYQTVFLDTNIILDAIENRDKEVKKFVNMLVKAHNKERILLSTSIFNIYELLDKQFEISYYTECMKEKISSDAIIRRRNNRDYFYCERSLRNKNKIIKKLDNFLEKSGLEIFYSTQSIDDRDILFKLLGDRGIRSQDAIILSCALDNDTDCFLTSDGELIRVVSDIIYAYNLTKAEDRDIILRTVLT